MFGILVFFVGCLVNATTPQMMGLIAGRTVQGLGGGCVMTMSYVIVADLAPLKWRPRFQSGLTVVYGLASVVGTLIGKIPHITIRRMCQLNLKSCTYRWCVCWSAHVAMGKYWSYCQVWSNMSHITYYRISGWMSFLLVHPSLLSFFFSKSLPKSLNLHFSPNFDVLIGLVPFLSLALFVASYLPLVGDNLMGKSLLQPSYHEIGCSFKPCV